MSDDPHEDEAAVNQPESGIDDVDEDGAMEGSEPAAVALAELASADPTEIAAEPVSASTVTAQNAEEMGRAAIRLQSAQRGKRARMSAQQRRAAGKAARAARELDAATTLQAVERGAKSRREQKQRKQRKDLAATKIQARYKGKKERRDPNAESNVRRERLKLDAQVQAEQYLERHQLSALFGQLAQALLYAKPDDPKAFLVSKLQTLRGADDLSSPMLFFGIDEIDALYDMYDVAKRGMTIAQCTEALKALGIDGTPLLPAGTKYVSKADFTQMIAS
ncbi:hypothetical protein KFE25_013519 [Diacronema lutheri]|uniref:Uncharacterized protein n=1 Tax=Diacronema lutheri TaxID=2081491 RepID=A0A8J5XT26_DIALT|nr:hypothetical protein KFE25_013519 [Diacronema lutheri]